MDIYKGRFFKKRFGSNRCSEKMFFRSFPIWLGLKKREMENGCQLCDLFRSGLEKNQSSICELICVKAWKIKKKCREEYVKNT